ncbi:MAG TPA: hypothetical protein IAD08_02230 [Candidatus Scatovivens faecipullorum]|nr:hypothetical protein [Candidatus Scatovivens faecipullorum]
MTKNVIKALVIALVAVLMIASLSTHVNATMSFSDISEGTVTEGAQDTSGAAKSLNNIIGAAITVVQVVGVGVAIIMLIVLAIKYISAAPGDKADIKKHAVVYVVGAVVLFAASGILGIVKNFAQNVQAAE